jgi:hypothetical protein
VSLIYLLLVLHFVGDFIAQSDWMAINKSKDWWALTIHVAVYQASFVLPLVWFLGADHGGIGIWLLVNSAAHFIQDAITARINSRLWVANQRHWFFVGIGADQLLHYVTLFATAGVWLR